MTRGETQRLAQSFVVNHTTFLAHLRAVGLGLRLLQYLREVVESEDPGGGDGQVGASGAHQGGQRRPVPAAVVGHGLVLARQVGEGALHGLGDGEAGVIDDVPQVGVGQQILPLVDLVDGEQHGLGPAEGAEVEPWRMMGEQLYLL